MLFFLLEISRRVNSQSLLSTLLDLIVGLPFLTTSPTNASQIPVLFGITNYAAAVLRRASSPPMSSTGITNCTSRHSALCTEGSRGGAEGYCWFRQGRIGQVGTKERESESDSGFS